MEVGSHHKVTERNKEDKITILPNTRSVTVVYDETQLRSKLMQFDTNCDGRLSKKELHVAFKSLGSRWADFRATRALHHADRNDNGVINDDEFDILVKYIVKIGYTVK